MTASDNVVTASFEQTEYHNGNSDFPVPSTQKIEVRGDVRTPGEFSYQKEADIFHYLNLAGGSLSDPKLCNLIVVRQYGEQKRSLLFRLDQKDYLPRVKQGDLIIITELSEAKKTQPQFHKPAIVKSRSTNIVRPKAEDFENTLPARGQALKKAVSDYIRFPQFKRILNQIATHQAATGAKSIAVMSCESGEGKSFFCSALGLAYARFLDSQVLIIDSNREETLRSPYLAIIRGDYSSQVQNRDLHSESAFVDLTSVSEIDREYHENSDFYFSPYINSVKSNYDLVLVDTCATSDVMANAVDPMIIASQVDGVILINSPISLDKKRMEKFNRELKKNGASVIGTVFNSFVQN